ncbi:hypothetical protein [Phenylobacterium sp.]|uniref:hypothetical protein n=1 Tax=Phenylobacterium sp. TaxID=1871053 RepID=UPI002ED9F2B9
MARAGFNPLRRNRNIGTAKQGHGQDNRLVIPELVNCSRRWTERLGRHQQIQRVVGGREIIFIVEETSGGCFHACSVDDVRHVLAHLPAADWEGLDTFVLRQSTRKQRTLRPAWGRLLYSADLGVPGRAAKRIGPAVILEAVDCKAKRRWPSSLDPDDQAELERLKADGHVVERIGRQHVFSTPPEAARATQLYRTLLHEIGHWVEWLSKVERPSERGGDFDSLCEAYFQRPKDEREAFAHRYADQARERLTRFGVMPFERLELRPPVQR